MVEPGIAVPMPSNVEMSPMAEFLNILSPKKLCDIARSLYLGGSIRALSPDDAKMLIMPLPFDQIVMCKKVPITALVQYLNYKGIQTTLAMKRRDFCLAFKALYEYQSRESELSVQPEQLYGTNDIVILSQNNYKASDQSCHPLLQQMPMPMPTSDNTTAITNNKDQIENVNEDFGSLIEVYTKTFYNLLNNLNTPKTNQLNSSHFFEICQMDLQIYDKSDKEINQKYVDSSSVIQCLMYIRKELNLYFLPQLRDGGIKWIKEAKNSIKVCISGSLYQDGRNPIGEFKQQLMLGEDPHKKNQWKLFIINLTMKWFTVEHQVSNYI